MNKFTAKANTVDEAIKRAAQAAINNQGPDAMVEFDVEKIRGIHGGIGALHQIEVTIKEQNVSKLELCDDAIEYKGFQKKGMVTIVAYGSHQTSGYKVSLQQKPIEVYPPEFFLVHQIPTGKI